MHHQKKRIAKIKNLVIKLQKKMKMTNKKKINLEKQQRTQIQTLIIKEVTEDSLVLLLFSVNF